VKYRGQVKNGVVVLDKPNGLPDGTHVEVEPVSPRAAGEPRRGSAEAVLRHAGIWEVQSEEVDRMLEELRRSKQAEVDAQQRGAFGPDESLD
jgi:hypothetical protein